ncbi:MAG: response regulator [Clostridium sp.]|nr:response regulator [Clostridium sp.]
MIRKNNSKKQKVKSLIMVLICLFITVSSLLQSQGVCADEKETPRVIRVGYYTYDGFQEYDEEAGRYSGYSYDYIMAISQYTGWVYEFVPVTFREGLDKLQNGELDLMNNVSKTEDREEIFDFSTFTSGENCAYLISKEGDTRIAYEDYEAFNDITVGLAKSSIYSDRFIEVCKSKKCMPRIVYYETPEETEKGLNNGEIDACIITSTTNTDYHILAKFAPESYYFATTKGNEDIIEEIDFAINSLQANDPYFESRLYQKYYGSSTENYTILTDDEKQFVSENPVIKVTYDSNSYPISYTDKSGNFAGAIKEIYDRLSEKTGLKFEFIPKNVNPNGSFLGEEEGIVIMAELPYDYSWAERYDARLTQPFTSLLIVEVSNGNGGNIIAIPENYYIADFCQRTYGSDYIYKTYPSIEECVQAVKNGEADFSAMGYYSSEYYRSIHPYSNMDYKVINGSDYNLSIAIAKSADQRLYSIIQKGLNAIDQEEISDIFHSTVVSVQNNDLITFAYNNAEVVIVILLTFGFLIAGIIFSIIYSKQIGLKNKKIEESKNMIEMQNRELNEAVVQADSANEAKSQFLSSISHEIRTPMNAIVGITNIAKHHTDNSELVLEYLDKIDTSSRMLLSIINDVLDMSAIESNKIKLANETFDMKAVLTSISNIYYTQCQQKQIMFEMDTAELDYDFYIGDSLRLNQILLNLVSNAFKFTPAGGRITITVKQITKKKNTAFIRFIVKDTGAGMSKEMQQRLFKPFEQENANTARNYGGSGLGLSIAKNLVNLMKGAIDVESEKGKGTTFTLDIPFDLSEENVSFDNYRFKDLRILIVDDDEISSEYTTEVMERLGVYYDVVESGEEAIEVLKDAYESKSGYDVCFVDWKMPGIGGIEVTSKIRELYNEDTLIIIVSAYDTTQIMEEGQDAGVNIFLTKPLFQSTVYNILMQLSGGRYVELHSEDEKRDFTGMHVLVVDDVEMNSMVASELLEIIHVTCDIAENGQEALNMFTNAKPGTYDVILMDIQMPIMDGYESAREIRTSDHEEAKTIPIYAMSADSFAEDISHSISAGMNGHISKPISTEVLYSTLEEIFVRKQKTEIRKS